jgi:class 3 adenylate cyclase/tetratricopeptide (TPR) repeat protein
VTCPQCRHENPAQARFCMVCGARLAARCASCGIDLPSEARFCFSCGAAVATGTTSAPRSPDSYTPKHLAERILTSKAALEGERKQVTVLFADLKGSMELLADRDPEEARKILDPVLEHMMEAVHRYEGTVNQVMGDGIMALFGAPLAHEDHAVRACYAALRIQESVKKYGDAAPHSGDSPIRVRVGLNSGEVVVRAIGSDLHLDYTAVGQMTHVAARMEQLANPGTILLTPATLALAEGFVEVSPLGLTRVKGLAEPMEIFELTGASSATTRLEAMARRGMTAFVGRRVELEQLERAAARAAEGHGQMIAAVAEPGVGKSRLFWEFTRSRLTDAWCVVRSHSVAYRTAVPWQAAVDLLRDYFQIEPRDDGRKITEKVAGRLLALGDSSPTPAVSPLLWLLDVATEDAAWERIDAPQRRRLALDAIKRLFLGESFVRPLILVMEDLHWVDAESQELLEALVDAAPTARMLLLVNYRPEYQHAWAGRGSYSVIRLEPLPSNGAEEVLTSLLGTASSLAPLKQQLVDAADGNPFFLEEMVRNLSETGVLTGEQGTYRLARVFQTLEIPPNVEGVLATRIDRLSVDDKDVLQTASVIGLEVPFTILAAVVDKEPDAVRGSLARLQAAEFLYETRLFPELEYTFKHALTREVAYKALLHERRRRLHAGVVAAIETHRSEHLGDHVEPLARHALRGELWSKAATYGARAGEKSLARAAYQDAVTHFEQALDAHSRLPEGPNTLAQAIDVRISLRGALIPLGRGAEGLERLLEAERIAAQLGDRARLSSLATVLSHHLRLEGRTPEARRYGHMAIQYAEDLGDSKLIVAAHSLFATAALHWGEYDVVEEHAERVLGLLEQYPQYPSLVMVHPAITAGFCLSGAYAERGKFDAAIRIGEHNVKTAEGLHLPFSIMHAVFYLAVVHSRRGDLDKAARLCERALSIGRDSDMPFLSGRVLALFGYVKALSGDTETALAELRTAVDRESTRFRGHLMYAVSMSGEVAVLGGRLDEAEEHARHALSLAVEGEARGTQAWIHRLLGEIATLRNPPAEATAVEEHRKALALGHELGMRPLIAHSHAGLAKFNRRTGRDTDADIHFATASEMYREMGMTYWLEKAATEAPPSSS